MLRQSFTYPKMTSTLMMGFMKSVILVLYLTLCMAPTPTLASPPIHLPPPPSPTLVIVGSVNMDIIIPVHRLPAPGETTTARAPAPQLAVGGKGANQAIAAAKLLYKNPPSPSHHLTNNTVNSGQGARPSVRFVCRFGNDGYAEMLEGELKRAGVDVSGCSRVPASSSGQGMVLLEPDGAASSVVLGGSNSEWSPSTFASSGGGVGSMDHVVKDAAVVLLQREIPEHVNLAVAKAAAAAGVVVLQDIGGEDRPISNELLGLLEYVAPNESELQRLTGLPTATDADVIAAARSLIKKGARNVLVTLAERGSLLVTKGSEEVVKQAAFPIPGGKMVDATAAGDAFRAGFAVALAEGRSIQQCLEFAAAAGAITVSKMGAAPSLPTRKEVLEVLGTAREGMGSWQAEQQQKDVSSGNSGNSNSDNNLPSQSKEVAVAGGGNANGPETCSQMNNKESCSIESQPGSYPDIVKSFPLKFASRLNSMAARRDLATASRAETSNDVYGWISRQSRIQGLELVDFNYPQHLKGLKLKKVSAALSAAGLATGAICIRFPSEPYGPGAFSHPEKKVRESAVELALEGCKWAADLGARDLIVWSPYDGYDYHFQMDYVAAWNRTVTAFQLVADGCPPGVRVSIEFKPTDESTRFSVVPSTGSSLLLVNAVNRPNFGLTLDVGHLLMAGENPAQSVAAVGSAGKLFGMQLNDAHVKLGAEDGLAFGAVNPKMALELVWWLQRVGYRGHIYYDTFPRNEDPVQEAEYNIRRFKAFWAQAEKLTAAGLGAATAAQDALAVLELLEREESC